MDAELRTGETVEEMRLAVFQNRDKLPEGLLLKLPSDYAGAHDPGP